MTHRERILTKLAAAWDHAPNARLGQLLESVENVGWDISPQRVAAPRLLWMGNDLFEAALDQWNADAGRKVVGV
jgi:hypothetical protein